MTKNMKEKKTALPVDESENAASASEMTGLIPSLPENEGEADAYQSLYAMPRQKTPDQKKR